MQDDKRRDINLLTLGSHSYDWSTGVYGVRGPLSLRRVGRTRRLARAAAEVGAGHVYRRDDGPWPSLGIPQVDLKFKEQAVQPGDFGAHQTPATHPKRRDGPWQMRRHARGLGWGVGEGHHAEAGKIYGIGVWWARKENYPMK